MSKAKRKVTVDSLNAPQEDRKRPSVFERLGPGAVRRTVGNYDESDSDVRLRLEHVKSLLCIVNCVVTVSAL